MQSCNSAKSNSGRMVKLYSTKLKGRHKIHALCTLCYCSHIVKCLQQIQRWYRRSECQKDMFISSQEVWTLFWAAGMKSIGDVGRNEIDVADISTNFDTMPAFCNDLRIPSENIKHICNQSNMPVVIGEGGFGKVVLVLYYGSKAAMKVVKGGSPSQHAQCLNEIRLLEQSKFSRIVQFYGFCLFEDKLCMVMEYMDNLNLFERIGLQDQAMQWHARWVKDDLCELFSTSDSPFSKSNHLKGSWACQSHR